MVRIFNQPDEPMRRNAPTFGTHLCRFPELSACIGLGRTQIYSLIRDGLLMPPVRLGAQSVAWPSDEVDTYVKAKIRGASNDELRALVARLVAARATAGSVGEVAGAVKRFAGETGEVVS
ncbi:MAG: AlpA family phage regulatory protein [Solimonas sp.]